MGTDEGFFSRWSRRKTLVRDGVAAEGPAPAAAPPVVEAPPAAVPSALPTPGPAADEPLPTLDDVARLPADADDFSRFVAPRVPGEVRNAAMKKLFADPRFNVMDGLDVYIDDYGKPDPLPAAMLRRMEQSRALGLLAREPADAAAAATGGPAMPDGGRVAAALPAQEGTSVVDTATAAGEAAAPPREAPGRAADDPGPSADAASAHPSR